MKDENVRADEALLERGRLLLANNRPKDAEAFLRQFLAQDPSSVMALYLLAICLQHSEKFKEALEVADRALAIDPEWGPLHSLRSVLLTRLHRLRDARIAAQSALSLDATDADALAAMAYSFAGESRWFEAEESARKALAADADNVLAQNILSQSLIYQKKTVAAGADMAARLARDPEDAFTHYNAGYAALSAGDHRKAEQHFLESLRLDPELDAAREGLLESFRARNALYRGYLRYAFAMSRLSDRTRSTVIIGGYLAYRFGVQLLKGISPLLAGIVILAYFLFATWTFVARGVGNLLILVDGRARLALRRKDLLEGALVGGGYLIGLPLLLFGLIVDNWLYVFLGGAFLLPVIPIALLLHAKSRALQLVFAAAVLVVVGCAVGVVTALFVPGFVTVPVFNAMIRTASWTILGATILPSIVPSRE